MFHGYHGVLPEENRLGQKFMVEATLFVNLRQAGRKDNLEHTVSYAEVYRDIQNVVEGPPRSLIESVAEEVCQIVLAKYSSVQGIQVHVMKPHVAVVGPVSSLGIEIFRTREDL